MTGSRVRLALLAATLLAAGTAAAQVGPPIRLTPPGVQPNTTPPGAQPTPPSTQPGAPPLNAQPTGAPSAAQPAELTVGLADDAVFGVTQWDGTSRPVALALLRRMPTAIPSPILHAVARRLLAAAAPIPPGEGAASALLSLRLDKLGLMGETDAVAALLAQLPANDASVQQARRDMLWLGGKSREACALAKEQLSRSPSRSWQQSQIACAALAGERDEAALGLQILHEQNVDDPTFEALVEMASGTAGATLPKQPSWSPVSLGLAQGLKGGLPPDVLRSTDASVLRAIAEARETQPILRLAAAERAAILGAIAPAELARLYGQIEFAAAEKADPVAAARSDDGPRGRALLYVAIQSETSPGQRAELLRLALDAALRSGSFAVAAKLYQPLLVKLPAAPELARMALPVGQALYLTGDDAQARGWYRVAHEAGGPDGGGAATRLWALGRLAEGDTFAPLEAGTLVGWYELQQRREAASALGRLALFYALIEGLGDAVPGAAWEPLVAPPTGKTALPPATVDSALAAEMRSAAESARVGETTLLVLASIGARLPGPEATLAAYDALVALRFAGLEREARALAVEIALAAGL